jgi:hypothetical protein
MTTSKQKLQRRPNYVGDWVVGATPWGVRGVRTRD